jgi:hypothetical protein
MRAYFIDPELRICKEVEGEIEVLFASIGDSLDHATLANWMDTGERDYIWVDDQGLLRGRCWAFKINGAGPFAGKAIIIGADRGGETKPPAVPLWLLQRDIEWLDEIIPQVDTVEESTEFLGRPFTKFNQVVTYSRAKK